MACGVRIWLRLLVIGIWYTAKKNISLFSNNVDDQQGDKKHNNTQQECQCPIIWFHWLRFFLSFKFNISYLNFIFFCFHSGIALFYLLQMIKKKNDKKKLKQNFLKLKSLAECFFFFYVCACTAIFMYVCVLQFFSFLLFLMQFGRCLKWRYQEEKLGFNQKGVFRDSGKD